MRGRRWAAGAATAVMVLGLLAGATPALPRAAAAEAVGAGTLAVEAAAGPVVHTPSPAPGALLAAADVAVRVRVRTEAALASYVLSVDGAPATAIELERDGAEITVATRLRLEPGPHVARLEVRDVDGRRAARAWSFTTTARRVSRVSGPDRFATAAAVSRRSHPQDGSAGAAVLARADDFADALAGAPLAAAVAGPLLLATGSGLPTATVEELRRVLPAGATVHLLGGGAALGTGVAQAVRDLGFVPVRHAGRDRFATAAAIARLLPEADGAIVASGASFPDALAASAPAARDGLPILLVTADALPDPTAAVLRERGVSEVTVVGGAGAVGAAVEQAITATGSRVRRVSGRDRYATAVAVLAALHDDVHDVALASGAGFPDALAGAPLAAAAGLPLLLTDPAALPPVTAGALRGLRPDRLTLLGGTAAVSSAAADVALRVAESGPDAPAVVGTAPAAHEIVATLDVVRVTLDRVVDPARSSLYVEVGGSEVTGRIAETAPTPTLTLVLDDASLPPEGFHAGRIVVGAAGPAGVAHAETPFGYRAVDPVFATADGIALHLPSRGVELVGFHQSLHNGARQLAPRPTSTPTLTLASRGRGTGSRTAADVVADPALPVLAPASGRVIRASSYLLYCRHGDEHAVIAPDDRPAWEVKVLHVRGLRVAVGDRVEAGRTVLADGPRALPFRSQIDAHTLPRAWPHVHVEVVDPSIPAGGGGGC